MVVTSMGGGLKPRSEYFNFHKGDYSGRHARPGAIDANDTPFIEAIWIGILNVC